MYCWNCGHKNPDANKFCGDCGKIQVRPPVFVDEDTITDNVRTMNRPAEPPKPAAPVKPAPPVAPPPGTGIMPTRLVGTNPLVEEPRAIKDEPLPAAVESIRPIAGEATRTPAPQPRPSADLQHSRISGPSFLGLSDAPTSGEYLLDEEQETDGSSGVRSILALALVLLFAFLVYKQWDSVSAAGREVMQRAGSAIPETTQTAQNTAPQEPVASDSSATSETTGNDAAKADDMPQGDKVTDEAAEKSTEPESTEEKQTSARTEKETATVEPPPAPAKADRELREAEPRAPVYDQSQIDLAEKYLQGRGVAQDCHRGITLLRQAASQPNPRAQIKLGALYATGHCVEQDRAEAYRWFAEAHQLQPNNQWIDRNLSSLWAQMSSAERARVQR